MEYKNILVEAKKLITKKLLREATFSIEFSEVFSAKNSDISISVAFKSKRKYFIFYKGEQWKEYIDEHFDEFKKHIELIKENL